MEKEPTHLEPTIIAYQSPGEEGSLKALLNTSWFAALGKLQPHSIPPGFATGRERFTNLEPHSFPPGFANGRKRFTNLEPLASLRDSPLAESGSQT
ncbi:hypothetical protein AVEN_131358-1 [Araneus ventricosus]|uniref:Uncharacterized protein n=1 Tax=Araneus ventricosus TaxID=182803 RepID=A0A4Y2R3L6_ARAVE|nr:hypothetical protein AVEN_131358-1 [Araneus ventricosus]